MHSPDTQLVPPDVDLKVQRSPFTKTLTMFGYTLALLFTTIKAKGCRNLLFKHS